jgi:hypothetical protein
MVFKLQDEMFYVDKKKPIIILPIWIPKIIQTPTKAGSCMLRL